MALLGCGLQIELVRQSEYYRKGFVLLDSLVVSFPCQEICETGVLEYLGGLH